MSRIRGALQSPWVRGGFVVVALAAAAIAVWLSWPDVYSALTRLDPLLLVAACLVSPANLVATMLVWRVLLSDLGSHLTPRDAFAVFFVSQLGKYLPGSFWNVVAAAELGADRDVPRRRSLTGMAVALLLSLVTGLGLGVVGLLMSPQEARGRFDAVLWLLPFLVVLALPPVVNWWAGSCGCCAARRSRTRSRFAGRSVRWGGLSRAGCSPGCRYGSWASRLGWRLPRRRTSSALVGTRWHGRWAFSSCLSQLGSGFARLSLSPCSPGF